MRSTTKPAITPRSAVPTRPGGLAVRAVLGVAGLATVAGLFVAPSTSAVTKKVTKKTVTKKSVTKKVAAKPTTTKAAGTTTTARPSAPTATTATMPSTVAMSCKPVKIMPLGDSLTAFAESYRGPLYRSLVAAGYRVDFVGSLDWAPVGGGDANSEGHGGFTIGPDDKLDSDGKPANIAQNIDAWLKLSKPDVVLLTIGTNDLSGGNAMAAQAPQKLRSLVAHMHSAYPDMTILVGDVPPNAYNAKSASTEAVNDAAKSLGAESASDTIYYAPTAAKLLSLGFNPASGTSDGTHFTVAGGELFAKAWLSFLRPVLDARNC